MQFSAAVEASVLREGAYSWSIERLKDSQGAYAWSKDVVLQAQSLGQQRLQSLGLLPEWLRRASVAIDEGVMAGDAESGDAVWALLLLVAWTCESLGPATLALSVAGAAAATAGAIGALPLAVAAPLAALESIGPLGLALKALAAWVGGEAAFYVVCCAAARAASRYRAPCSFASSLRRRVLWRRILADPSQPPQAFVQGWMYRRGADKSLSPTALLLRWAGRKLAPSWVRPTLARDRRAGGAAATATATATAATTAIDVSGAGGAVAVAEAGAEAGVGAEAEAAAAAVPPVVETLGVPYADLSVGDVYSWLAGNLYGL